MASRTDDFPKKVILALGQRAAYICSNPECRRLTAGPHSDPARSLLTGIACHIRAAQPGGPRYSRDQNPEERRSPENGVWLCAVCSAVVDKDPKAYPAELLSQWKRDLEDELRSPGYWKAVKEADDAALREELGKRHLDDPKDVNFCWTDYSTALALRDPRTGSLVRRYNTAAVLYLLFGEAPFRGKYDEVIKWLSSESPGYDPIPPGHLIPGPLPARVPAGYIWRKAARRVGAGLNSAEFTKYLVIERGGYVEYGFLPYELFAGDDSPIYYAFVVAGFLAFLGFIHDLMTRFDLGAGPYLGLCLRGTLGRPVRGVFGRDEELGDCTALPAQRGFLFQKRLGGPVSWSPVPLAREAAIELLVHWSYPVTMVADPPEFKQGAYTGDCFRDIFASMWYSRG